jgi:UDPglucose 6-dehydrogenase
LEIIADLVEKGAIVRTHDPKAALEEIRQHKEFEFYNDPYGAVEGCDALVVVTEWPEYRQLDFDAIKAKMKHPVIFDPTNMLDDKLLREKGFEYYAIGRGGSAGLAKVRP